MKKKIMFIVVLLFVTFFGYSNVHAVAYGRITNGKVYSRKGPGTNYGTSTVLYNNDVVPLFNTTPIKSSKGCSDGWYKVNINGTVRYICKTDLSLANASAITKVSMNIRNGHSTSKSIHQRVAKNTVLTIENVNKYSGKGCSKGWYQIHLNGAKRYACSDYLKKFYTISNAIVTNYNGAPIKKSSKSSSATIATLKYGQAFTIHTNTNYKGSGCSAGWYKVYYKKSIGYVCRSNAVLRNNIYRINEFGDVNVREKATTSSKLKGTLSYVEEATLLTTTKYKGAGCSDGWYQISFNGGPAFICSTYLTNSNNTVSLIRNSDVKEKALNTSKTIISMQRGNAIILKSTTKYKGTGCSNGWYNVSINGTSGYICSSDTEFDKDAPPEVTTNASVAPKENNAKESNTSVISATGKYYTINSWNYRLSENYGNIRSAATTSSSIKDVVYMGTEFEVLGTSGGNSGCSAGWYKVKYYTNKTGYVCKSLVNKYSDVTKNDTSYCNTLKQNGFPESYCPFLSYLHSKHPNWVFKAENTGITLDAAVNGESEKNYTQISTTARSYLASTTIREAGGWRTASDAYIAFMLDPRNYLNEQNIFAFEELSYDSKFHTSNVVKSIFNGTYLATNEYVNYFMDAANTYKVSPIHLASRVKQEGATNPNYDSISGNVTSKWQVATNSYICAHNVNVDLNKSTISVKNSVNTEIRKSNATNSGAVKYGNGDPVVLNSNDTLTLVSKTKYASLNGCSGGWYKINASKSLKGFYNYYNIGAYGSNPVLRGLATAAGYVDDNAGTPWNTRAKAIKYGAAFIANGYINEGQDTMYYQKFNIGPNNSYPKYTHQYMTNILAPASESLSVYESYNSLKLLNNAYVFKIPVYKSMPANYTTHPPVK